MIARILSAMIGVWFMAVPALLNYGGSLADSDRIAGPVIATVSIIAASQVTRGLRWTVIPFASWLIFAPIILGQAGAAIWIHHLAFGAILIVLTFFGGKTEDRFGGGWSALWE